jgi:glycosyltransferase involved in cell wall biosynthesis
MKILEICPFSAGICGVWARVKQESLEFSKLGYKVRVFSSDIEKGTGNFACEKEILEGLNIRRFRANADFMDKALSRNVTYFNFEKAFLEYSPDIVITHLLHPHSFKALELCKKKNIPCYLVTHAPFNVKRRFPLNLLTGTYNLLNVKPKLNQFTKIIAITRWELPYLAKLGVKRDKIIYIPNGLPEEFFKQKKSKSKKSVLFLGRIAPVKNLEVLLEAAKFLPNIGFSIVGSAEEEYFEKLKQIIAKENIHNVKVYPPIYDVTNKIKLIDEHSIFALPSLREAMPQVLLEAMSRGKIVISSSTDGGKEVIQDSKTGFIFPIGDSRRLADLIKQNLEGNKKIQKNAEKESKRYQWAKLIKQYPFVK